MEERTIKELLQLMLKSENLFGSGLCILAFNMHIESIISFTEYIELRAYLDYNLPLKAYKSGFGDEYVYCFPYREWQPRKEWIEQQIEKFKD